MQSAATASLGTPSPSLASYRSLAELGLSVPGRRPLLPPRFDWAWRMQAAALPLRPNQRIPSPSGLPGDFLRLCVLAVLRQLPLARTQ